MVGIPAVASGATMMCVTPPFPWFVIPLGIYVVLFGVFWIVLAIKQWWPSGIGLVFTRDGITWRAPIGSPWKSWMIEWRWDDVLRAHYVTRRDIRFAGQGAVILELTSNARAFPNAKWAKRASQRLQKSLGRPLSDNVAFLVGGWWNWQPGEAAAWINQSVDDPESRSQWAAASEA